MKSDAIINMEIAVLAELAKLVPETVDGLPVESKALVLAQAKVLTDRLDNDDVHDIYLVGYSDDFFLAVLHASDWAHDQLSPEHDYPPSMDWRDVVKYEDGAEGVDERAQAAIEQAAAGLALEGGAK